MVGTRVRAGALAVALAVMAVTPLAAQARRMAQDSTLDNLRHGAGTVTVPWGTLGRVTRTGTGDRAMILIAGMGFGDDTWTEFMERRKADYTMFAVTLPGFGGTAPLPMPAGQSRYADADWTRSAVAGVVALMDRERLTRVTLVAHWAVATQVALQVALEAPDRVHAIVLVAGAIRATYPAQASSRTWTAEQRSQYAEAMAARWFRAVTRDTWDDNNYMPYDYAVNQRRGLFLWREAQAATLPVWIRYLLEFYAVDLSPRLAELHMPVLVVHPDFDDAAYPVEQGINYMKGFTVEGWAGVSGPRVQQVTVSRSRLCIMFDRPDELDRIVNEFLARSGR